MDNTVPRNLSLIDDFPWFGWRHFANIMEICMGVEWLVLVGLFKNQAGVLDGFNEFFHSLLFLHQ